MLECAQKPRLLHLIELKSCCKHTTTIINTSVKYLFFSYFVKSTTTFTLIEYQIIWYLGVFSGLREIIHREHFFALYKGNFAQMVRIFPYAATQFTAFEIYKKVLNSYIFCLFVKNKHFFYKIVLTVSFSTWVDYWDIKHTLTSFCLVRVQELQLLHLLTLLIQSELVLLFKWPVNMFTLGLFTLEFQYFKLYVIK